MASVRSIARRLAGRRPEDDEQHPERLAVLARTVDGRTLEIGCGPRKTDPTFTGIDLVPGGTLGRHGNAAGRTSQADVAADGGRLPIASASIDQIVARHNLEHYVDLAGTLIEWRRCLKDGGRLVAVVPDEDRYEGRTLELDPTHFHAFNERAVHSLLPLVGFDVVEVGPCVEGWSLVIVATAR